MTLLTDEERLARGDLVETPPADEPPAGDPPAGEKAQDEPPAGDPPAGEKPAGDPPAGEPPEGDDHGIMIPKHRYDNAARMRREAEERARRVQEENEALRAQLAASATAAPKAPAVAPSPVDQLETQLGDLDKEIAKAQADGDTERQVQLMGQARKVERQLVLAQAEEKFRPQLETASTATVEGLRYDDMVAAAEADHPEINPDAKEYDETLATEVLELKDAFEAKGYRPTAALEKALGYVFPDKPVVAPPPATDKGRKPDIQQALERAGRLPPDMTKVGVDSDKGGLTSDLPSPTKLTDAELAALPEETRRRLRGDYV